MAAGQMAEFFATFGFKINQADIAKVDKQLNILEARARKMSEKSLSNIRVNISRFSFSADFNTRLHKALKARMKVASGKGVAPEITLSRFVVDKTALLRQVHSATRHAENSTTMRIRTAINRTGMQSLSNSKVLISRFGFSADFNTRLHKALKARMRVASGRGIAPEITLRNFVINKDGLLRQVKNAVRHVENSTTVRVRTAINRTGIESLSRSKVIISRFGFSADFNTRLNKALKARMRVASGRGIAPEITLSNFVIDRSALLREMKDAIRYVENNTRIRVRTGANRDGMRGAGGRGGEGGAGVRGGIAAGGAAGAMRGGALPALAGIFGVSKLNQVNQQLIGQERAATAVFQGKEQGQEQLGFVKDLGNRIGFDYRSQADPYLKMAAAGTTAGMSTDGVQGIFTGMAEYSRVMGLSGEDMKGSMRAVEQMLNKGQVYSEELKMQ